MFESHPAIVVAIDGDQPAVLSYAIAEARRIGTRLRVVHVAAAPGATSGMVLGLEELRQLRAAGAVVLSRAKDLLSQDEATVEIEYQLLEGLVLDRLARESVAASCIVVGADDQTWYDRMLNVGVASHLASRASCPVVVVPERAAPAGVPGQVVVALDGESAAAGPLSYAFARAQERQGALHVLHALRPGADTDEIEVHRANIAEVLAGWSAEHPEVRLRVTHVCDSPEDACETATEQADLVVLGQSHHMVPLFSRPVIRRVLHAAHCPVAVVPLDASGT